MEVADFADVERFIEANSVRSVAEFVCDRVQPYAQPRAHPYEHLPVAYARHDLYPKLVAHLRASFNPSSVEVDYTDMRPADLCVVSGALKHWPVETAGAFLTALAATGNFKHVLVCLAL